jgi:hypothetical protein
MRQPDDAQAALEEPIKILDIALQRMRALDKIQTTQRRLALRSTCNQVLQILPVPDYDQVTVCRDPV